MPHPTRQALLHALALLGLFAILALLSPLAEALTDVNRNILMNVGLNIILAVSLSLLLGLAGQFSLGHAGFLAAGAYTAIVLAAKAEFYLPQLQFWHTFLHLSVSTSFALILLTSCLAATLVTALLGFLVGLPTLRLRGDYLAIATLGFGEIVRVILQNSEYLKSTSGISIGERTLYIESVKRALTPGQHLPPLLEEVQSYMTHAHARFLPILALYTGVLVTIAIVRNLKYSTTGRALLAVREDLIAAEAVGIPTTRYKVAAFVIAAALAGLAGGFLSHQDSLDPHVADFTRSITIVTMVILGGQGSITGAVLAAIILTVVPELLRSSPNIERYRLVISSLVIIFAMLFRPQGLFGRYEISDLFTRKAQRHKGTKALREEGNGTPGFAPAPLSASVPQCLSASPLLSVNNLTMQFGGLRAVDNFSLSLLPGELVALIGPNGAGKTTVFNALTGVYRPTSGSILLAHKSLNNLKPNRISKLGVARTFQNIRLFSSLSVLDNVQIAQHVHHQQGIPTAILRTPAFYAEEALSQQNAHQFLALFNLDHLAHERANSLSYGDQRRLEIARALATKPQILLLDEPAAGMNPTEKRNLMDMIQSIRLRFNLTILLIEHDMKLVMGISERIIVLDYGKTIATGTPAEIRKNPAVIEAYLGKSTKHG